MNNPNYQNRYPVTTTKKSGVGQIILFVLIAIFIVILSVVLIFVLKNKEAAGDVHDQSQQFMESQITINGSDAQFGCYIDVVEGRRFVSLTGFCRYVGFKYEFKDDVYTITSLNGCEIKFNINDRKYVRINQFGEKNEGELSKLSIFNNGDVYVLAKELAVLFDNVQTEYIAETRKTDIIIFG